MINVRMQPSEVKRLYPKILVIGVGGAGGNAVNNMISSNLEGVEFLVCNTDSQALDSTLSEHRIQLGNSVTGGLGAGAKPEVGHAAAEESLEEVSSYFEGANMAFITAGMGGGTGTGAAPVIAKAARERGILTVGVITKPFHFEGSHRMKQAEEGIEKMQEYVDTLIVIPNQNLFRIANEKTTFAEAFKMADSVLQSGVRGVTDLMIMPGLINLDFADIRSAMQEMGKAMMGNGEAEGDKRAIEAAEAAINNPLLDDVSMKGARGVIINVTGGYDMTLFEADEACNRIRDEVDPGANIIFGATFDEKMEGLMRVSVVATGIEVAARRSTGNGGGNFIERAQPNTRQSEETDSGETDSGSGSGGSGGGGIPAPRGKEMVAASAQNEPEADMFEQQEYASLKRQPEQGTALKGTMHEGAFIPPRPVTVAPQETGQGSATAGYGPQFGSFHQRQAGTARPVMTMTSSEQAAPTTQQQQQQYQAEVEVPAQTGMSPRLNLQPPVPGSSTAERRKAPSLFERIKGGLRDSESAARDNNVDGDRSPSGENGASLRAPQRPSQGRLDIDAPSKPAASSDSELDIPAFLRRQAN